MGRQEEGHERRGAKQSAKSIAKDSQENGEGRLGEGRPRHSLLFFAVGSRESRNYTHTLQNLSFELSGTGRGWEGKEPHNIESSSDSNRD